MGELLRSILSIPPPFNMVVLIVLILAVVGLVKSFVKQARIYACHRQELAFKQDLIDRGLAVDEIERIVRATPAGTDRGGSA